MTTRRATFAGTWYDSDEKTLRAKLSQWMGAAPSGSPSVCGVISPHAGFSYSGPTAGQAYGRCRSVVAGVRRVIVLGPSHRLRLSHCGVSSASWLATPLGRLPVDGGVGQALISRHPELFSVLRREHDEAEHSLELQFPFLAALFGGTGATVVPIMVGALGSSARRGVGEALRPLLREPGTFVAVSSDFCHWGRRFSFQPCQESQDAPIHAQIEEMDRRGMALISAMDAPGFQRYLKETGNTICGRHPISCLLHAVEPQRERFALPFVAYAQSSRARTMKDSSVSYAAAVLEKKI